MDREGNEPAGEGEQFEEQRTRLIEQLQEQGYAQRESTRAALLAVPRHEFVPPEYHEQAYADRPLPIGDDQTISAPHMVARMLDLLALRADDRVLEVGTGCGYHAALSAEVVGPENVYTVEFSDVLAQEARERLADLGYGEILVRAGDGSNGWPEHAPFDAAYLTCAGSSFPGPVVAQVRPGGRLLAPLKTGGRFSSTRQTLVLADKRADGGLDREEHGSVRFVPLRG